MAVLFGLVFCVFTLHESHRSESLAAFPRDSVRILAHREATPSEGTKAVCQRDDEESVVMVCSQPMWTGTVKQSPVARQIYRLHILVWNDKTSVILCWQSHRQFFFLPRDALPFWEECAEDSQPNDQTQECVHIRLTQQSAFCGVNHNPCYSEDILWSLFKDEYIYMDDD